MSEVTGFSGEAFCQPASRVRGLKEEVANLEMLRRLEIAA